MSKIDVNKVTTITKDNQYIAKSNRNYYISFMVGNRVTNLKKEKACPWHNLSKCAKELKLLKLLKK